MSDVRNEAVVFGSYLLSGKKPDDRSISLYESAHQHRSIGAPEDQKKLLEFVLRNRWALGAIDGALAFKNPDHVIRRKLLVMSAVLECRPQYADLFIPKKRNLLYIVAFGWIGFRAVCKAIFGFLLVKIIA